MGAPVLRRPRRIRAPRIDAGGIVHARRVLAIAVVIAATLSGGYGALATFTQTKELSVGQIRLSVSPGHRGALDVYVPLVDWGARFEAIRLPARLRVDLRTVDRETVARVAQGARDAGVLIRPLLGALAVSPPLILEQEHIDLLAGGIRAGLDALDSVPARPDESSGG